MIVVSIHATLAGGDMDFLVKFCLLLLFLSTPPSRVATSDQTILESTKAFLSTPPSRVATC